LIFSAALRGASLNTRLAELAAQTVKANGGEVDLAAMADFDAPSYNADLRSRTAFRRARRSFEIASPAATRS
jgi:chromate reductase